MLARLSNAVRALDAGSSGACPRSRVVCSSGGGTNEGVLVVDIPPLNQLLPIPESVTVWRNVAGMCGQAISPLYRGIQGMLLDDIEHVAQVLSEVESREDHHELSREHEHSSKVSTPAQLVSHKSSSRGLDPYMKASQSISRLGDSLPHERPRRKRRRSSCPPSEYPIIIPSADPSVPTIVITPCDRSPLPTFGHVPYQDAADGRKLTVPLHPAFNALFPPMAPTPYMLPQVGRWRYIDGHWHALLPDLDEQAEKGVYSRALTMKNRHCRRPARLPPSSA